MPYKIVKFKNGFRVRSKDKIGSDYKFYSKKPMTKEKASKQLSILERYEALKQNYKQKNKPTNDRNYKRRSSRKRSLRTKK